MKFFSISIKLCAAAFFKYFMKFNRPIMDKTPLILQSATLFMLSIAMLHLSCDFGSNKKKKKPLDCTYSWHEHGSNPVINMHQAMPKTIWNDPSVIKEGGTYRMWLSGGSGLGVNHVRIYQATSADGLAWTISTNVLLEPNPAITVSGTMSPAVSGEYRMSDEFDVYNGKPKYKHATQNWYLWYDSGENTYYLSNNPGTKTDSWKKSLSFRSGTTILDGAYDPVGGTYTGNPQAVSDWDSEKTETPMVVRSNDGKYHMYYSGFKMGDGPGQYQTGHATSTDGTTWVKDPANPVIAYQNDDLFNYGFYQAAEPGVVYKSSTGTFYLYYTTVKYRGSGYSSDMAFIQAIALSTSTDGSAFTHYDPNNDGKRDAVLVQSTNYPVEQNFKGYSTPYPLIDSAGIFHLFYSVVSYPTPGAWSQTAIAHATSVDGTGFTEIEHNIYAFGAGGWRNSQLWGPSVLQDGADFKMWFAGENGITYNPISGTYDGIFGIGYTIYKKVCQ